MARRLTRDNVSARVAAVCYLRIVDPMRAIIGPSPAALQLRHLQTRGEVGAEPGSTIVLPLPKGTIKPFSRATGTASAAKSCSGVLGASSVPPHSGARAVRGGSDHAGAVAIAVLLATGTAMASHYSRWGDEALQAKLAVLVLAAVLTGLHIASPRSRALSLALMAFWTAKGPSPAAQLAIPKTSFSQAMYEGERRTLRRRAAAVVRRQAGVGRGHPQEGRRLRTPPALPRGPVATPMLRVRVPKGKVSRDPRQRCKRRRSGIPPRG